MSEHWMVGLLLAVMLSPLVTLGHVVEEVGGAGAVQTPPGHMVPHPPIRIDGDGGFAGLLSGVRGGNGTADDPYIIENWLIPAGLGTGIELRNTRAHVLVREVTIAGATPEATTRAVCRLSDPSCRGSVGILLVAATNVSIEQVRVFDVGDAFAVYDSHDISVLGSVVGLGAGPSGRLVVAGIVADRTSHMVVEDILIQRTWFPLVIDRVTDVRLERLEASGGIVSSLFNAERTLILGSRFQDAGLFVGGAMHGLGVIDTTFAGGNDGLGHLDLPEDRLEAGYFCGNRFEGITGGNPALYLPQGQDVVVRGNVFRGSPSSLGMKFTDRAIVDHNDVEALRSDAFSVVVQTRTDSRVHNNTFLDEGKGVNLVGPVDARSNWWGASDGPGGDVAGSGTDVRFTFMGGVVDPWLTSSPHLLAVECDRPTA